MLLIDTHASTGLFDLRTPEATRSPEFKQGIHRVEEYYKKFGSSELPEICRDYFYTVKSFSSLNEEQIQIYPGSPILIHNLMREDDRLVLSELHPQEIAALHSNFVDLNCNKNVRFLEGDGYQIWTSFIPPLEKRGLVLCDPPYEKENEFKAVLKKIKQANIRWSTGTFFVWFPIKNPDFQATWERELKQLGINKMLLCKLLVRDPTIDRQRLNGCGILILNPPYQLDQDLSDYMPWLAKLLGETPQAMGSCTWLTPDVFKPLRATSGGKKSSEKSNQIAGGGVAAGESAL